MGYQHKKCGNKRKFIFKTKNMNMQKAFAFFFNTYILPNLTYVAPQSGDLLEALSKGKK